MKTGCPTRAVRSALSALGRLPAAALVELPRDLSAFVTDHLRTDAAGVAVVSAALTGTRDALVRVAVARLLDAVLRDDTGVDGLATTSSASTSTRRRGAPTCSMSPPPVDGARPR